MFRNGGDEFVVGSTLGTYSQVMEVWIPARYIIKHFCKIFFTKYIKRDKRARESPDGSNYRILLTHAILGVSQVCSRHFERVIGVFLVLILDPRASQEAYSNFIFVSNEASSSLALTYYLFTLVTYLHLQKK